MVTCFRSRKKFANKAFWNPFRGRKQWIVLKVIDKLRISSVVCRQITTHFPPSIALFDNFTASFDLLEVNKCLKCLWCTAQDSFQTETRLLDSALIKTKVERYVGSVKGNFVQLKGNLECVFSFHITCDGFQRKFSGTK